jgi:hypothetical protein
MDKQSYGERLYPRYSSGDASYGFVRFPDKKLFPLSIGWPHFSPGNPENDSDHHMTASEYSADGFD